ncbi:MAG: DnaJ domain-containing protein [Caulobacter sp.]|nr:DnaJ domain-containing protein [Caulobacter sp.]
MDVRKARDRLGVKPGADERALRAAFREAAKRNHPDRPGGDPAAFRETMDAYRFLRDQSPEPLIFVPVPAAPRHNTIDITPAFAVTGGPVMVVSSRGRRLKISLPAGLRPGERVRAGADEFEVLIRGEGSIVRGDDLWITIRVSPDVLVDGGRILAVTPRGERSIWISRKAAARALVRLPGEGLPARGAHRQGDLFVRLAAGVARGESPARRLLRQFAAAWAA